MITTLSKKILVFTIALAMGAAVLFAPLAANAASFTESARIKGDGVRLRNAPISGAVLELMYNGEWVLNDIEYDHATWNHIKRLQTGTSGYVLEDYLQF